MKRWVHVWVALLGLGALCGCASPATPPAPGADLVLTQSADRAAVATGENITFTITLTNRGPNGASGIVFGDTLPEALLSLSCSCSVGSETSGTYCELDHLGSGQSATATVVATPASGSAHGQTSLTARAVIAEYIAFDPDRKNNSASVPVRIVAASAGRAP